MNREVYVMAMLMGHGNSTHLGFQRPKLGVRAVEKWMGRKIRIGETLCTETKWKKKSRMKLYNRTALEINS